MSTYTRAQERMWTLDSSHFKGYTSNWAYLGNLNYELELELYLWMSEKFETTWICGRCKWKHTLGFKKVLTLDSSHIKGCTSNWAYLKLWNLNLWTTRMVRKYNILFSLLLNKTCSIALWRTNPMYTDVNRIQCCTVVSFSHHSPGCRWERKFNLCEIMLACWHICFSTDKIHFSQLPHVWKHC